MANCARTLIGLKHTGLRHEFGQNHRHHDHRDTQHPAFRSFFRLTERLVLSHISALFLAVSLCFCTSGSVFAQDTPDEDVVRVNTDLLLFPIRIRDKKGRAVHGLTEQDLTLKDEEKVTTGVYFAPGADRVAMLFALDQSGSLQQIINQQRDAALALFSRFSDRSSVAILRFAENAKLVVPFTKDTENARAGFRFRAAPNQRTALFDAAAHSLEAFDDLEPVRAERRIVVLISDGLDNQSAIRPDSIIDVALEKRVSFYVIHLPLFAPIDGRLEVRRPTKGFKELAEKTGGKYFLVGDRKSALMPRDVDLTQIFDAIEEDLKSQYLLGFYIAESARDNRRHVFSVSLKPEAIQYSVGRLGFSRTHKFMINSKSTNDNQKN
ncbi:MAG TPA: VWA domain-containing protein [Pyrinomonadaceae bacterium]|nr:VWA domain-containing protein [Pyrinomonadaceae bacterium]